MKKKLVWDKTGERLYETGVSQGVLYPIQTGGVYNSGTAWNGLSTVTGRRNWRGRTTWRREQLFLTWTLWRRLSNN